MSRILITSTYFYPYISGLSLYPYRLAKLLVKQGHQVSVLTFQHEPKLLKTETIHQIKIIRLTPHLTVTKGLINFLYPFNALKQVISNDQILVNCPGPENVWVSLLARLLGKKLIVLYHCDLELQQPWYYKPISQLVNFSSWLCCLLANRIISSSQVYTTSSSVLKYFRQKVSYHHPLTEDLKADTHYLKILKKTYQGTSPVIGFVGRFSQEKNLETLILALSKLKKQYPKLLFVCAGPFSSQVVGEKKYYQRIQTLLSELELNYAILGILPEAKLQAFFAFIDLLVLPSKNRTEAFGIVQIEALKQGTPVVAANSPGIDQVLKISKAGALFKPSSEKDLQKQIVHVFKHLKTYQIKAKQVEKSLELKRSEKSLLKLFSL